VDCPHCSLSTPPLHAIPARLRRLRAHLLLLLRARVAGPRDACRGWGRSRFNRACCAAGGRFNYAQALGKQPVLASSNGRQYEVEAAYLKAALLIL